MSSRSSQQTKSSFTSLTSETTSDATCKHLSHIPFNDINNALGVEIEGLPPAELMHRVSIPELCEWSRKINATINRLKKTCRKYSTQQSKNPTAQKNYDFKSKLYSDHLSILEGYKSRIGDLIEGLMFEE